MIILSHVWTWELDIGTPQRLRIPLFLALFSIIRTQWMEAAVSLAKPSMPRQEGPTEERERLICSFYSFSLICGIKRKGPAKIRRTRPRSSRREVLSQEEKENMQCAKTFERKQKFRDTISSAQIANSIVENRQKSLSQTNIIQYIT